MTSMLCFLPTMKTPERRDGGRRPTPSRPRGGGGGSIGVRRVVLVAYPGAQVLDVAGPAAVFAGANRGAGRTLYTVEIASSSGRPTPTSGGAVTVETRA